jgi:cholesterol oxidase
VSDAEQSDFDADVVVVGSGFGGAVAALRFAEAGHRVTVLERGPWIERDGYHIDLDWFWLPHRNRFGMNEVRRRGKRILPWLGAGVGGGSHVFAGTLKRAEDFSGYPEGISAEELSPYYELAEDMMGTTPYPDYPPYSDVRATQLLLGVGEELAEREPDLVEDYGVVPLAISFAPEGEEPGAEFVNQHGAKQRYFDPHEQSLLGGDIGAKNTLDKNYLHLAQEQGAEIQPLTQVDRIEPLDGGGYRLDYTRYVPETRWGKRWMRKWLPRFASTSDERGEIRARRVVLAAGAVGSTEILLRGRDVHGTLPELSDTLGGRYTTNGDFLSLILPFRGIFVAWAAFIVMVVALFLSNWWMLGGGALAYYGQLLFSRKAFDPDIGTTNSDYIRFRGLHGRSQGAYIESGRYPTPLRLGLAVFLSVLGLYHPNRYRSIIRVTRTVGWLIPPFGALARSWPIPLLKMGRDDSVGTMKLDRRGEVEIEFDLAPNRAFYRYLDDLGKKVARAARAFWVPNILFKIFGKLEIPHNQGGVPMGESAADGVVDHAGRVFHYPDLMVLDGSIMPTSPGPNPALTILALTERAMPILVEQLEREGAIRAAEKNSHTSE